MLRIWLNLGFFMTALGATACSTGSEPSPEKVRSESEALHADLLDPPTAGGTATQCFGMHCCPSGYGVRGLENSKNQLLCRQVNQKHEDCFIDGATERAGVHACPSGTYVRGIRGDRNRLACCYDRERGYSELQTETSDGPAGAHQEFGMHACPVPAGAGDALMTGVNPSSNQFLCSGTPATPSAIPSPINITLDPESPRTLATFVPAQVPQATWKAAVQNWLLRQFDIPPPPSPSYLQPVTPTRDAADVVVDGGVTRRLLGYPSLVDGTKIPAYLFLPPGFKSSSSYPGVLVVHGHFSAAKDGSGVNWDAEMHAVALYLAQNGFVTLAPDTRTWGAYHPPGQIQSDGSVTDHYSFVGDCGGPGQNACQSTDLFDAAGGNYGALAQQMLLDNLRSVTVLGGQAHLSSLGVEGLSLGADQAMWLAAVDNRIGDVLLAGNFIEQECLNAPGMNDMCQTVPGISKNFGDLGVRRDRDMTLGQALLLEAGDVAGLIAPRRLYAMFGGGGDSQYEQLMPDGSNLRCSDKAATEARATYARLGQSSNFFGPNGANGSNGLGPVITGMQHEIDNTTSLQFFKRSATPPSDQLDYGTQCNGMHCCPAGKAMAGIHVGRNDFICRDVLASSREECTVDTGTQRANMHACPAGNYLRGVDLSQNFFTCCHDKGPAPKLAFRSEAVDGGTQVQGMHACLAADPFMTGFNQGQNQLLCDAK
jgi:dienelactone hydrolase